MAQRRRRSRAKFYLVGLGLFVMVFGVAFVGIQFITKTGIFRVPGVVHYDKSLKSDDLAKLQAIFTDEVKLDKDVTISVSESLTRPELKKGQYVAEIKVPVTDFNEAATNIEAESPEILTADPYVTDFTYNVINLDELDFSKKLLSINGKYYLDEFDKGAIFKVITFESDKFDEEIKPLVENTYNRDWPDRNNVLTMAQTGVTALARGMNQKLDEVNDPKYFSALIGEYLRSFDITHTSNESSFSEAATSENICSDPRFIDTLLDIGLDVVELTGNHNVDCGGNAAINTVDIYQNHNIKTVGGGKNAEEAAMPLEISEKGNKITMLAYNLSTGGATVDETPGANQYDEEQVTADIAEAKQRGDLVIVDVQYYECSAYASEEEDATCDYANSAAGDQVGLFRHLIDLGADVVVGTSAHQPQTFELYGDGVIYYGLGNLFFDQAWWPGTTRSLILAHYFYNGKLLQTKIVPTVYDENYQTKVMEDPDWYLRRLLYAQPSA